MKTKAALPALFTACLLPLSAQNPAVEITNLREDVRILYQRIERLELMVEQLQAQNSRLQTQAAAGAQSYATVAQLNEAIAEVNRAAKAAAAGSRTEILGQIQRQLDALARQTNDAFAALSRNRAAANATAAVTPPVFSTDFPKEGITYTVQRGDTISVIARKTGAKVQDIINANRIADATKLMPGEKLFIPGAKE
ncbi:MAG: LysM peptidoglycan-binding domain-containing protein [Opitutaceae bacterium]|nr:LysM peptidoglycan-binding domain-containing protein [Opitutaceae bacterium]